MLPTAEAVRVRNVMKAAVERHRKRLYDTAQKFWTELTPVARRDRTMYHLAVMAFMYGNLPSSTPDEYRPHGLPEPKLPRWPGVKQDGEFGFWEDLNNLLSSQTHKHVTTTVTPNYEGAKPYERRDYVECKPRRVLQKDVDQLVGKAAGATFTVHCGEPSIHFDKRKVTWSVPENNHACDRARTHLLAREFFGLLETVTWTRGSGGDIVGNNEYARDSREEGGGGNYLVTHYGPDRKSSRSLHFHGARR